MSLFTTIRRTTKNKIIRVLASMPPTADTMAILADLAMARREDDGEEATETQTTPGATTTTVKL